MTKRKNKSFHLRGPSGKALIESIRSTIRERSSEWRLLANVPSQVDQIEPAIASVRRDNGDEAARLRDADQVSARKQSFAVRLRDFESFERNLPAEEWLPQRREFVRVACEQMVSLPAFFELATYFPRLVALSASSGDIQALVALFAAIARLPGEVRDTCRVAVAAFFLADQAEAGDPDALSRVATLVLDTWAAQLIDQASESLISGWRGAISSSDLREILAPLRQAESQTARPLPSVSSLRSEHSTMARRDLAHRPYRWSLLSLPNADKVSPEQAPNVPLDPGLESGLNLLVQELRRQTGRARRDLILTGSENAGLAFATRPPSAMELFWALRPRDSKRRYGVAESQVIEKILRSVRGSFGDLPVNVRMRPGRPTVIQISTHRRKGPVRVALSMLDTKPEDAIAAVEGSPNLSLDRLIHMRDLLNSIALHPERPDYLLLPELAMPAPWFLEFARGLRRSGISLVAGVEHQPRGPRGVTNQVWAALRLEGLGLPFLLYQQDKQRPARPEMDLLRPRGKSLRPAQKWRLPPVIEHREFRFALLICSELTNIDYRAHLRGAVDALFIPEWNQDLHSFEALVESAALDLHSYIAQANTRGFGDTRLRAPMAKEWERDVVRLKGGLHDYFVVGQIDFDKLRAFQSTDDAIEGAAERSELKPELKDFKPLPDGFEMDPKRM